METEIKLTYTNREGVISVLENEGFRFSKSKIIKDTYLGLKGSAITNSEKLYRIREVESEYSEFTLKDKFRDDNGVWSKQELNVKIDDPKTMMTILKSIGFEMIRENHTKRDIWEKENIDVEFIDITKPAKLIYIEVECEDIEKINRLVDLFGDNVKKAGEEIFKIFDVNKKVNKNKHPLAEVAGLIDDKDASKMLEAIYKTRKNKDIDKIVNM